MGIKAIEETRDQEPRVSKDLRATEAYRVIEVYRVILGIRETEEYKVLILEL